MAKKKYDYIDRFLEEADTYIVPEEFISAACVTYLNGDEQYITFEEASDIISNGSLKAQGIKQIRAIIDMEVVKDTVIELSEQILSHAAV
ncbi:hypothetical protein D3C87_755090 [compost metagenome]